MTKQQKHLIDVINKLSYQYDSIPLYLVSCGYMPYSLRGFKRVLNNVINNKLLDIELILIDGFEYIQFIQYSIKDELEQAYKSLEDKDCIDIKINNNTNELSCYIKNKLVGSLKAGVYIVRYQRSNIYNSGNKLKKLGISSCHAYLSIDHIFKLKHDTILNELITRNTPILSYDILKKQFNPVLLQNQYLLIDTNLKSIYVITYNALFSYFRESVKQ